MRARDSSPAKAGKPASPVRVTKRTLRRAMHGLSKAETGRALNRMVDQLAARKGIS